MPPKVEFVDLCDSDNEDPQPRTDAAADDEKMEIREGNEREDEEIRDEREDEEKSEEAKEEFKKSEERGTFYYEDGEIRGCYASCMKQRSPTPTNPSYSPSTPTYDEWVKISQNVGGEWLYCL